jgi:flagellar hook assembly protein FlgD
MYVSNYPNPFNPSTKLEYYVPESSKISIDIFNVKGQKVNGLCSGFRDKGIHQINWNGKDDNGNNLGSGVYFASFNINGRQITKKMIMLK